MSDKNQKRGFFKAFFSFKNISILIILILFIALYFKVNGVSNNLEYLQERDSALITEIGEVKQSYQSFNDNINEVREFLRMPTKTLEMGEIESGEEADGKNDNKLQLAMFQYFEYLGTNQEMTKNIEEKKKFLEDMKASEEFGQFLTEQELTISEIDENEESVSMKINTSDDKILVSFYLAKDEGVLYMKTVTTKESVGYEKSDKFISETKNLISTKKDSILEKMTTIDAKKSAIEETIASESVQSWVNENGAQISSEPKDTDLKYHYEIMNGDGEVIAEIVFDQNSFEINLVDLFNPNNSTLAKEMNEEVLTGFLKTLDTASAIDRKVNQAKAGVEATIKDSGFQSMMQKSGFVINDVPTEDEDRYYYEIYDPEGTHISSIVVEKTTAVVNIVEPDGTNSENLLFFDPNYKKKTLELPDEVPEYGDELSHEDDTFNVLIAGKHGNLVDTMIFAHLNETKGTVRMVSIPRDLHYNGRKINSFPHYYGMPELKRVLSDMTGYELDHYILIDMYAFIDVIDLIGGVDVHLDKPLIDPTYVTEDDGVWGTLHYEPGDYHLGGKEALRLARSRHTSSDFARAERQQLIIEAIQDKARNFGFGDADTIYDIAKTVLAKTETDVSLDDAIVYYFKYQNYKIESNAVMSSGNVLYSPPYVTVAQCESRIAAAQAAGQPVPNCMGENHAYILIPRNNNWNLVKWFFKENFEGEGVV